MGRPHPVRPPAPRPLPCVVLRLGGGADPDLRPPARPGERMGSLGAHLGRSDDHRLPGPGLRPGVDRRLGTGDGGVVRGHRHVVEGHRGAGIHGQPGVRSRLQPRSVGIGSVTGGRQWRRAGRAPRRPRLLVHVRLVAGPRNGGAADARRDGPPVGRPPGHSVVDGAGLVVLSAGSRLGSRGSDPRMGGTDRRGVGPGTSGLVGDGPVEDPGVGVAGGCGLDRRRHGGPRRGGLRRIVAVDAGGEARGGLLPPRAAARIRDDGARLVYRPRPRGRHRPPSVVASRRRGDDAGGGPGPARRRRPAGAVAGCRRGVGRVARRMVVGSSDLCSEGGDGLGMRFDLWSLVRFLHVVGAVVWVGGQLTLTLIVRPVTARLLSPEDRRHLVGAFGSRFGRLTSWVLIPLLLATGLALTYHRGVALSALTVPGYGATLGVKITLALISFALAIAHGVVAVNASTKVVRVLGIVGTVVSLTVVALAASLVP